MIQFAASYPNLVACNPNNSFERCRDRMSLDQGYDVFMAVSLSHDLLMKEKVLQNERNNLANLLKFKQIMPLALLQLNNEESCDMMIRSVKVITMEGSFYFERHFTSWDEKEVYVFKHIQIDDEINQIFLFEACRMKKVNKHLMIVEKSILLIVDGKNTSEAEVTRALVTGGENISMTDYEFDEFEVNGLEICDHLKFYVNECSSSGQLEIEGSNFFLIFLASTLILTVIVSVIVSVHKNCGFKCKCKKLGRIFPSNN